VIYLMYYFIEISTVWRFQFNIYYEKCNLQMDIYINVKEEGGLKTWMIALSL